MRCMCLEEICCKLPCLHCLLWRACRCWRSSMYPDSLYMSSSLRKSFGTCNDVCGIFVYWQSCMPNYSAAVFSLSCPGGFDPGV